MKLDFQINHKPINDSDFKMKEMKKRFFGTLVERTDGIICLLANSALEKAPSKFRTYVPRIKRDGDFFRLYLAAGKSIDILSLKYKYPLSSAWTPVLVGEAKKKRVSQWVFVSRSVGVNRAWKVGACCWNTVCVRAGNNFFLTNNMLRPFPGLYSAVIESHKSNPYDPEHAGSGITVHGLDINSDILGYRMSHALVTRAAIINSANPQIIEKFLNFREFFDFFVRQPESSTKLVWAFSDTILGKMYPNKKLVIWDAECPGAYLKMCSNREEVVSTNLATKELFLETNGKYL